MLLFLDIVSSSKVIDVQRFVKGPEKRYEKCVVFNKINQN